MSVQELRDAGLRRHISYLGFTAAIVNGVVGVGIFTLPSAMVAQAGSLAPLAYLLSAGAMLFVVVCFAEIGGRLPTSGGTYGAVALTLGPSTGFVCGIMTWMASVLGCGGVARTLASLVGQIIPAFAQPVMHAVAILVIVSMVATVNLRGIRQATWIILGATIVKLVPLVFFVVAGAWTITLTDSTAPSQLARPGSMSGLAEAAILAMFAFSGMEVPFAANGEVQDGRRNVPRAVFSAMSFVLVLYLSVQLVAQGLLGSQLGGVTAPLVVAARHLGPVAYVMLAAGSALSMLVWMGSDLLGSPRILFAFARDGLLPPMLGRTNRRTHAPDLAILAHALLAATFGICGDFDSLIVASTLNAAGVYMLGCLAAWLLHRQAMKLVDVRHRSRLVPAAAIGGMTSMALLVCVAPYDEIIGLAAVVGGSLLVYAATRSLRSLRSNTPTSAGPSGATLDD